MEQAATEVSDDEMSTDVGIPSHPLACTMAGRPWSRGEAAWPHNARQNCVPPLRYLESIVLFPAPWLRCHPIGEASLGSSLLHEAGGETAPTEDVIQHAERIKVRGLTTDTPMAEDDVGLGDGPVDSGRLRSLLEGGAECRRGDIAHGPAGASAKQPLVSACSPLWIAHQG